MSEEDIKINCLLPYLAERGYKQNCMDFELPIEVHEGRKKKTIFADVLVYTSASKKAPLLLCETKAPSEPLSRSAREQAISYARLLPQIAPLVLLTNGTQWQVFHTLDKTRLADLPKRSELDDDLLKFVLSADAQEALRREAKHELFIIDDVQKFKSILKSCHNEIRNNEGLDPTAAFDEMSKVMFCKLYEEEESPKGNRFRLSVFDDSLERLHFNVVHKILQEATRSRTYKDILSADTVIHLQDRTIRKIVELFEDYDLGLTAFDIKGEAFEYFLGDTFTGGLGEYFTPRNVVEFMVDAMDPRIGEKIIDPFCGTGGFLIFAFEKVSEKIRLNEFSDAERERWRLELSQRCLFGTDWKERIAQACNMNMTVHGDGSSGIFKADGLRDVKGVIGAAQFDLCLTNPPFGSFENDPKTLEKYELGQGRKSQDRVVLAVERAINLLKPGGRCAIVLIDGVLNNASSRYVRDYIRQHSWVRGVVSLAGETFQGYGAGAKTSILFLERKDVLADDSQKPVFMAIASNTGLAPNGEQIAGNELPDILVDYREFVKTGAVATPHANTWVATLNERLDAEAYVRGKRIAVDLPSIRKTVETVLSETQALYAALAECEQHLTSMPVKTVRIGDILEEVKEREGVEADKTYRLLGVRWWGEGSFEREQKLGRSLKGQVFRATAGWLIYNRLFAFKGSFAVVTKEQDGCVASGEFPMFRARTGVKNAEEVIRYVVHVLNSPQYLEVVDKQSTGSTKTSRNRFNQKLFVDLMIDMPVNATDLFTSLHALDAASNLRKRQAVALESVKGLWNGIYQTIPSAALETLSEEKLVAETVAPSKRKKRKSA